MVCTRTRIPQCAGTTANAATEAEMTTLKRYAVTLLCGCLALAGAMCSVRAQAADATVTPAIAIEAEDFTVQAGWKAIRMGEGNYAVDIIGFMHTSGERFLHVESRDR